MNLNFAMIADIIGVEFAKFGIEKNLNDLSNDDIKNILEDLAEENDNSAWIDVLNGRRIALFFSCIGNNYKKIDFSPKKTTITITKEDIEKFRQNQKERLLEYSKITNNDLKENDDAQKITGVAYDEENELMDIATFKIPKKLKECDDNELFTVLEMLSKDNNVSWVEALTEDKIAVLFNDTDPDDIVSFNIDVFRRG